MVEPSRPWPREGDALREIIAEGDVQQARAFFDKAFWEGRDVRPDWSHLKMALQRQDKAMVRLLTTWGAATSSEQLAELQYSKVYPQSVDLLRQCGLNVHAVVVEEEEKKQLDEADSGDDLDDDSDWEKQVKADAANALGAVCLPREWKKVLQAFQQSGAGEAVIAGGALRDFFNERPIKDVDIFMESQGSERKNRKFLQKVFKAAGLEIDHEMIATRLGGVVVESMEKRASAVLYNTCDGYGWFSEEVSAESWTVVAGPKKTEYNIVFVKEDPSLFDTPCGRAGTLNYLLIQGFDFGLCQIACDGEAIITTQAYLDDIRDKKITLCHADNTSTEHLERIIKKYPDWELCAESKNILSPESGAKMPDGSIYLGFYKNKDWYVTAEDAKSTSLFKKVKYLQLTFNEAAKYASKLKAHGHHDWKMPERDILKKMYNNKRTGAFSGTYNEYLADAAHLYWSSTTDTVRPGEAWQQSFYTDVNFSRGKCYHESLRCVRSVTRPVPDKKNRTGSGGPG